MKLTPYGKIIKAALAAELEKSGSSILEFEKNLTELNTAEGAVKVASDLNMMHEFVTRPMAGVAGSIPGWALNTSAAAGAAGGITFDEMENSVGELNNALARERQKVHMIRNLTHKLKQEHGLN
jgi:hypothetical protein